MGNIITTFLYYAYNLRHMGQIEKIYKSVKRANSQNGDYFLPISVNAYLRQWNKKGTLSSQPIMIKKDIINHTNNVPLKKIHSWAFTGGSYGEPLRVPYSLKRNFIRTGTFKYFNELGGYHIGDSFALIRAKDKSRLLKVLRNEYIVIPTDISENYLNHILNQLIKKKVKVLIGYPTVMFELAKVLSDRPELRKGLKVSSLISASEMLDWEKRKFIYDSFGCSFIDRYSNEEVGLIAQQKRFGEDYFVNNYGVYVEIIDPVTRESTPTGQIGKILVTDVTNNLVPIIRYDTGDLAVAGQYEGERLVSLQRVIGREVEKLLTTSGKPISSLALGPQIYKPLSRDQALVQFQLVQVEAKKFIFKLKGGIGCVTSSTTIEITNNLQKVLGSDAVIKIEYVHDIPPQPSGKRPVYKYEVTNNL
ncbi:MAG: phenylacetate-CoA ligase [Salibacteraceae bacterium]|jgi:phenylacetate-CoA ligase